MELFKLFGTIAINNSDAMNALDQTTSNASEADGKFSNMIGTAAKWAAAISGAAIAAGGAIYGFAQKVASTGDNIDKMSQKIGISRQAYQELDFICSQSGTSVDNLQTGIKSLTAAMDGAASGTASNVEQFEKLGVSVTNADGSLRSQEDVLWETLTALQGVENQTERSRLATELFGRSGTELMPLLNGASGSIDEMRQKAQELGLVLDDDVIDSSVKLTDTMDQVKRSFAAVATTVGARLLPIVQNVFDRILEKLPDIIAGISDVVSWIETSVDWCQQHSDVLTVLVSIMAGAVAGLAAYNAVQVVKTALNAAEAASLAPLIAAKIAAAAATLAAVAPYVLIGAAIAAVIAVIVLCVKHWDEIKAKTVEVAAAIASKWEEIKSTIQEKAASILAEVTSKFNDVKTTISSKIQDAYTKVSNTFERIKTAIRDKLEEAKSVVENMVEKIKSAFDFEWTLPHFKLPHVSVTGGEPPYGIGGQGSLPSFSVEWYAKGAVLTEPTIFGMNGNHMMIGGEAGAEAVAPIDVLQGYVSDAVASQNAGLINVLDRILEAIVALDENMGGNMREALDGTALTINKREFGRLVKGVV